MNQIISTANTICNTNNYPICCFMAGPLHSLSLLRAIKRQGISVYMQPPMATLPKKISLLKDYQAAYLLQDKETAIIINWETSLSFILQNLPEQRLNQVKTFKNKATFRRLFKELYPDLFYLEMTREELKYFQFPPKIKKAVLKPSTGTASIGVRVVNGQQEWEKAVNLVLEDIERAKQNMSPTVLSDSYFLVEEFVEGEEFACDGFWDANGQTRITGIYQHPFLSNSDVSDTIYYTSTQVVAKTINLAMCVLNCIGDNLGLRRFPFHFEFRISSDGTLFPIELNPLRFGEVSLPDIVEYAFGFNPYELFFRDESPDWNSLLVNLDGCKIYAFVLGSLPTYYTHEKYRIVHESFRDTFGNKLLDYLPADSTISPFGGVAHIVADRIEDVLEYLCLDFDQFLYPCF
ncbi:MAG: ATP-grasp domain-containing protein [Symploca sp. SIO2E9]|nr:ATP-grasp domain-containing protein [Symploca sp. SIO2E9]